MSQQPSTFDAAITLIDAANSADPNQEKVGEETRPKELLYSQRMSEMLQRYRPDAADVVKLAVRGQHIERWKSARDAYPMDRSGYLKWRVDLYRFHAETVGKLLAEAGYDEDFVQRVRQAVGKRSLKVNADTQLLEDVASLVFIEHYLLAFVTKHPEYDEDKWLRIIRKTWKKLSEEAHAFALSGDLELPESLVPLIRKAVAGAS